MRHLYAILSLGLTCLLMWPGQASAQLPPNQAEQDCIGAIPVCQSVFVQANAYTGEGLNPNEINSAISCLLNGEQNDVWYIFTVQTSGNLCFTITPTNTTDDYDWALFNLTNASCADIATNSAIADSCNYSPNLGCGGMTGANGMTTGPCGLQNTGCVPVTAGETFVLNVSNFSSSAGGYTLDFSASSAVIFDNVPPQMSGGGAGCGNNSLEVTFSENVVCGTVDPADFVVTGPGGPYTVVAVNSNACGTGGQFEKNFSLTVVPAITTGGTYSIGLVGSVTDNCGNVAIPTTISVVKNVEAVFAGQDTICSGQSTTLSTSVSNLPGYTFLWTPGNLTTPSPIVSPTTTTTYQVEITGPGGCQSQSQTEIAVKPTPSAAYSFPATVCANDRARFVYTGSSTNSANYVWDFDGGTIASGSGPGPYEIVWSTPGTRQVRLVVEENGCSSMPNIQTVTVNPVPTATFALPTDVCEGDSATIVYTGSASPSAFFGWSIPEYPATPSTFGPIKAAWNTPGPRRITLQVEENGCFSNVQARTIDVIARPKVQITPVPDQCFPGNSFTFVPTGDVSDSYNWVFGASASPPISTLASPGAVTYQTTGNKRVTLVVTKNGCLGDTAEIDFEVLEQPSADFLVSSTDGCAGEEISFTYQGTSLGSNQAFLWEFGAGAIPSVATGPNPPTVRYLASGQKTVSLTTSYRGCTETTTQTIIINPSPLVDAGTIKEFCEGDGGVQLDASVSGGTQPYFYNWTCDRTPNCGIDSVNIEDPTVNPNITLATESVTYFFQVIDRNGCASPVDSVEVIVKAKPKVDAGADVSLCPESAFGAKLSGGLLPNNQAPEVITYRWSPELGINDPTDPNAYARPDTTTIYTLIATSSNGCSSDDNTLDPNSTVRVTVLPNPVVEAGLDTGVCFGESIQLQGFASGAGPQYNYSWTPSEPNVIPNPTDRTPTASPLSTTTFTLTVTSTNGCAGSDSVVVQVDTKPTVSAGLDRDLCQNDTLLLEGKANGDLASSAYSYVWSPSIWLSDSAIATPLASPDLSIQYSVKAISPFGCESDADVVELTVLPTPLVELLQQDTVICDGDSITLVAAHSFLGPTDPNVRYSWAPIGFIGVPITDSIVFARPTQSTEVVVTAATLNGRCATTDGVFIQVNPAVIATIDADTNRFCEGDAVQLLAIGGQGSATFTWFPATGLSNPNIANPIASPEITTTYQVVIDEGVCDDTAEIELIVNPSPGAEYFSSLAQGCDELTVSFMENAPNATAYRWDFGDGTAISNEPNPTHTFAQPGSYTVTLTTYGVGGCESTSSQTTIEVNGSPIVTAAATPSSGELTMPNATVAFDGSGNNASVYYWDFGDGDASNEMSPRHTYQNGGVYNPSLTIRDEIGCEGTVVLGPFTVIEPSIVVPNVFTPNADGLNDLFLTGYSGGSAFKLEISDRYGRQVFETDNPTQGWNGLVENNNAPEGVYFYTLSIGAQTYRGEITLLR